MNVQTTVSAPTIVCGGCASAIKKAIGVVPGVSGVDVDTSAKTVRIEHDERVQRAELIAALDRAGFPAA